MNTTDKTTRRARFAYAEATARRAATLASEAKARTVHKATRKEGAARRAYLQALRLADLEA